MAFALTEATGLATASLPLETGTLYLRAVGPLYGFFGIGLVLYFASQGAGRLLWPVTDNVARLVVAALGGWLAIRWDGGPGTGFYGARAGAGGLWLLIAYHRRRCLVRPRGLALPHQRAAAPDSFRLSFNQGLLCRSIIQLFSACRVKKYGPMQSQGKRRVLEAGVLAVLAFA
jgi:hypothetical protein